MSHETIAFAHDPKKIVACIRNRYGKCVVEEGARHIWFSTIINGVKTVVVGLPKGKTA